MKRLLLALLPTIWLLPASAELKIPTLTLKKEGRELDLIDLSVGVTVAGNLAETVLELNYRNEGRRVAEGEFALQLPEGATISTYALEVTGAMRPAVSVEKERARFAYESIKARNIDPGIVEKMADNVYRTRIFPIPSNGEKRVRIGFIHQIENGKYKFPFGIKEKLRDFDCNVSGTVVHQPRLQDSPEGTIFKKVDGGWRIELRDSANPWTLVCESETPERGKPLTRHQFDDEGNLYFFAQAIAEGSIVPVGAAEWNEFRIIWDVSLSGGWRDHEAEFAAIRRIVEFAKTATVHVHFLGAELSEATTFAVTGGNADDVIDHLSTPVYAGVADFSHVQPNGKNTILVTEGDAVSPSWLPGENWSLEDFVWIHSSPEKASGKLRERGMKILEVDQEDWWSEFSHKSDIRINAPPAAVTVLERHGDTVMLTGKIPGSHAATSSIRFGWSRHVNFRGQENEDPAAEWNFARRVWATSRLRELEEAGDPVQITEFAKQERLASEHTSLIVLERFSDHLTYNIPPPEPELLARYEREKADRTERRKNYVTTRWDEKVHWHSMRDHYPWFDDELRDELRTVGIWVKASRKAFPAEKRNEKPLRQFEKWMTSAKETLRDREDVDQYSEFSEWIKALAASAEELEKIRETAPVADPDGKIHVSLRGSLPEIGIFTGGVSTTLPDLINEAGGTRHIHDLAKVYLYRHARRIGFNMLSDHYVPTPMQWGDMVVVERNHYYSYLSGAAAADPFSAPAADGFFARQSVPSPADEPAVFEQPGTVRAPATSSPSQSGEMKPTKAVSLKGIVRQIPTARDVDEKFFAELQSSKKPKVLWQKFLAQRAPVDSIDGHDLVRLAAVFFEKDDSATGTAILQNLYEVIRDPVEATRTFAYWMDHFGETLGALAAIDAMISRLDLDESTKALLLFDRGFLSGETEPFSKCVEILLEAGTDTDLASIALTEYYRHSGKRMFAFGQRVLDSDIRVVVIGLNGSFRLDVPSPESYAEMSNDSARQIQAMGVAEHQTLNAFPGLLKPKLERAEPGTYRIVLYKNFGTDDETKAVDTVWIEKASIYGLGELDFRWSDFDEATVAAETFDDIFRDAAKTEPATETVDPFR